MRVAVFHPWLKEKGGAEKVVLEYARRSEHEVEIFTLFHDEEKCFNGFKDVEVNEVLGFEPRGYVAKGLTFALGSLMVNIPDRFDALLVSEAGMGSLATLRNQDIPVLCYCHTPLRVFLPEFAETYRKEMNPVIRPLYGLMRKFYDFLEKKSWRYFKKIFANSETTKKRIIEKGITEEDRLEVLNPGVNIDVENRGYDKYFLYPSRFRRYKRQDLAIKAFQKADLEGFELVLAGSAQEEDYIEELKEMAGDNVRFELDVSDERWEELYANAYSVLFCAEKEDWGIVPVEAGAYSKPVISVNEGGPRESVIDGKTGFLVDADPKKFAEKMQLLANDRELVEEIGNKAREESENYSWDRFAQEIDREFEDVG